MNKYTFEVYKDEDFKILYEMKKDNFSKYLKRIQQDYYIKK